MREAGKVVEIVNEDAHVMFNRTSACAKCGACGMMTGKDEVVVQTKNSLNAHVGDLVELEFTSKNAFQSTMLAYIFPLVMLFVGIFIGYNVPQTFFEVQDAFAAIMGLVFAFGSFLILRLLNPVIKKKFANTYTMVRIVNVEDEEASV